jgi:Tat protein translocase TatB subunit
MDLGFSEMFFIIVLAMIVFGPKRLPEIGRQIGKALNEFKRASNDFKAQLETEMRQIELEETLKKEKENLSQMLHNPLESIVNTLSSSSSPAATLPEGDTAAVSESSYGTASSSGWGALNTADPNFAGNEAIAAGNAAADAVIAETPAAEPAADGAAAEAPIAEPAAADAVPVADPSAPGEDPAQQAEIAAHADPLPAEPASPEPAAEPAVVADAPAASAPEAAAAPVPVVAAELSPAGSNGNHPLPAVAEPAADVPEAVVTAVSSAPQTDPGKGPNG